MLHVKYLAGDKEASISLFRFFENLSMYQKVMCFLMIPGIPRNLPKANIAIVVFYSALVILVFSQILLDRGGA